MTDSPVGRHYIVSGRVQGVGFRYAAWRRATALNLAGWVRNRSDGTVELVAGGRDADLDALEAWLWQGPRAAQVSAVERGESGEEPPPGFTIR